MKKAGFILSIIIATILYSGQAQSQSMFQKVIGGTSGNEEANYGELTSDGGQIIVGETDGFGSGSNDVYLVKTDSTGAIEWNKTYGGVGNDIGYSVKPTSDGGYIVVGQTTSSGAGNEDVFLIKTDAVGDTLWTRTFGGPSTDIGYSVNETFDGGYILAGYTGSFGTGAEDVYVIKTDASGDTLWTKTYGTGGYEYAYSIVQTADSGYVLTGETYAVGGGDAFLIKTNPTGDTTWTRTYGGLGFDAGWAVRQTMDGGYVFAGWTSSLLNVGIYDIYVVKTDAMGDTLWTRTYGEAQDDIGLSIVETADTSYLIGGYTFSFGTINGEAYGLSVDSMGAVQWSMAYGGVSGDAAYSIDITSDGGYVLTGYSYSLSGGVGDFYLLHTDSSGSTGSCYETSTATVAASFASNVGTLNVTSAMSASVGMTGTSVTTPAAASNAEFSVAITASTNITCFGDSNGTATAVVTGGTLIYTYSWDDPLTQNTATANSLPGGTYQINVIDGQGCIDSASVTITEPTVLTASITDSLVDIICYGDSTGYATVTPTGGTAPYTYLWDDSNSQTDSTASGLTAGSYSVLVTDSNGCQVTVSTTITELTASALTLSPSSTPATCGLSDGTVTVSASGATAPYTYAWNSSPVQTNATATALAFGTYTVVVVDSLACVDSTSATITNASSPTVSITDSVNVLCNGDSTGTATVTPVGGTSPYTYLWDDSNTQTDSMAVSLPAGTYIVNVTDNIGCVTADTVTLTEPTALSLSITNDTLGCAGDSSGTATVVATGGAAGYVYAWDDPSTQSNAVAIGLDAGAVQVVVTDGNGCKDSASVTLTEPAAIALMFSDSNHISCNGDGDGSATVSASGGSGPMSYLWDDPSAQTNSAMTNVNGGTYTCTVTDSTGCSESISITLNEPVAGISLSISSSVTVTCNTDESATLTAAASGGTGSLSYLWDDPNTQTTATATGIPNGDYMVIVTDGAGCTITDSLSFGIVGSISTSSAPVCGGICDGTASLAVTGNSGSITYSWNDPNSQTTASASSLCSGSTFTGTATDTAGCSISDSVTFSSLSTMTVTLVVVNVDCFGNTNGTATAFVSGGSPPPTYWWPDLNDADNFVNMLAVGNYDVIVTDQNGCTMMQTASVTEPADSLSSSVSTTSTSCFGYSDGGASVSVTGGTLPYQYNWGIGDTIKDISSVEAGEYTVEITDDNGCTISDTATVPEASSLLVSGSSSSDDGDSTGQAWVTVSGGTSPYTYAWDDDLSQTSDTASGLPQGKYTVVVNDAKGCTMILELSVGDQSVGVFETTYEGSVDDLARDMALLSGGGHLIAGITQSFGAGGSDMFLLSTDDDGNFKWAKTYGGAADDGANSVLQTSDGGYIMAGYTSSFGSGNTDMYIVKTDVDGVVEWAQAYGGSMDEKAYSIAENTGGYVIVGGTNSYGAGNTDVYAISIDDNGAILWTKTYGGFDYDYGYDIKATSDGGYIIAGYTNSFGAGGADAYLIKIDVSGNSSWTKVMGGDENDAAWAVIETASGYAFTGNTKSFGSGLEDVFFVITDELGAPSLTTAFGGSSSDFGNDLTSTTDGGFAIAGYTKSFGLGLGDDVYVIKTDGSGDVIWSRTYGGTFPDRAWAIKETTSGALVIAGNSQSFGLSVIAGFWEYYLIKTDGDGDSQCNIGSATTIASDTSGAPIANGALEASGGNAVAVGTTELSAVATSEILCYNTTDIQQLTTEAFELGLYPNPNNGQFTLSMNLVSKGLSQVVRIYNMNGELMRSEEVSGKGKMNITVDLGDVPAGMYYVQLISDGVFATKKVIIL